MFASFFRSCILRPVLNDWRRKVLVVYGGVAERLKAPVLKTGDGKPFESSNLSSSAINNTSKLLSN